MTKRRIGVSLATFLLALGLSPTFAQADSHTVREKKEKVEKVQDVGNGDAKGKAKEAAKDEVKEEARDAAGDAVDVDKGRKHK